MENKMEFIALGLPIKYNEYSLSKIEEIAENFNLILKPQSNTEIDLDIREGIIAFCNLKNLSIFQVIKDSSKRKKNELNTSSGISNDLVDFYLGKPQSILIDFLLAGKDFLPDEYFLIFSFEWVGNVAVRFEELDLIQIKEYFRQHNSWYLWLYDFGQNNFIADLNTPLIINVKNL